MVGQDVQGAVEAVVRDRLSGAFVRSVRVSGGQDHEGDKVLDVLILVNGRPGPQDGRELLGLVRHIRTALAAQAIEDFPIVEIVSKADATKLGLEAA